MPSVIFVCLGNINRSAVAEGLLRKHAPESTVKSAGTGGHFAGSPASSEMRAAARKVAGVDLSSHRAKQVDVKDFEDFDFVLAMDSDNFSNLKRICPPEHASKLKLFLPTYAPELKMEDTPDPYFVGGYDAVVEVVETAVKGLVKTEGFK
mmetsp:Transcript_109657/g.194466  ORF Transcript_109657/g.194466 Transcript_109657/m.194466 type:complete len:150 (-) Transcript_109657:30-479(-)